MTWRWAARVLAVILMAHAWYFADYRAKMVAGFLNAPDWSQSAPRQERAPAPAPVPQSTGPLGATAAERAPEEIRNAGRLTCASGGCESYMAPELWFFLLSFVAGVGLLIWSFWPSRRRRLAPQS